MRGTRKSEDALSIQIMDTNEHLRGFLKSSLREVIKEPASLMPAFGPDKLTDADLNDVLAFLNTLRGPVAARPRRRRTRRRSRACGRAWPVLRVRVHQ